MMSGAANKGARGPRSVLVVAFFAAGLYAGWRQNPVERPFLADTQIYYYIAERVAEGEAPHVSLIDHKHQLSSLVSGFAIRVGRVAGIDDPHSVRVASLAAAATTVAACAWLGAELAGGLLGGIVAGLAMLVFSEFFYEAAMGVRPQTFMACFMTLALTAFARRKPEAAAMWATCSFLCWQPAALVGAALAAVAATGRDRWRVVPRLAVAAIVTIVAYELYFACKGALGEQIGQSYRMASELSGYKYAGFAESVTFFVHMGMGGVYRTAWVLPALLLVVVAVAPLLGVCFPARTLRFVDAEPALAAVLLVSILNVAFTFLTHDAHPDMFFVEPLIAVATALVFVRLPKALLRGRFFGAHAAVVSALVVWLLWVQAGRVHLIGTGSVRLKDQMEQARQLDVLTDAYGSIWAVGCPHLLALAHLKNFHPLGLLLDPKVRDYVTREGHRGPRYPGSDGRLPGSIVSSRVGVFAWFPELRRYYRRVLNESFDRSRITVWVRNNTPFAASLR